MRLTVPVCLECYATVRLIVRQIDQQLEMFPIDTVDSPVI